MLHCKINSLIASVFELSPKLIIRLETRFQPNVGFTLERGALTVVTLSDITPLKVNRFG